MTVITNIFEPALRERQPTAARLITSALARERLANAYLFSGGFEPDKELLAIQLAMHLNCQHIQEGTDSSHCIGNPSTRCHNCRWIAEKKHPQVWFELANTESASGKVSVETARQLAFELSKSSVYKRIVFVPDASQDILHRPAANALLKTIEEPRADCCFLLVCRSKEQVLPTIVSRCQVIPFEADRKAAYGPVFRVGNKDKGELLSCAGLTEPEVVSSLRSLKELDFFKGVNFSKSASRQPHTGKSNGDRAMAVSKGLALSKRLADLLGNGIDYTRLIDALVLIELEIIGSRLSEDKRLSNYFGRLLELAEEAKLQLDRYVSKKAVLDNFALDWIQTREEVSG